MSKEKDWLDILFKIFILCWVTLFVYGMGIATMGNEILTEYCKSKNGTYETIKGKRCCLIDDKVEIIEWYN